MIAPCELSAVTWRHRGVSIFNFEKSIFHITVNTPSIISTRALHFPVISEGDLWRLVYVVVCFRAVCRPSFCWLTLSCSLSYPALSEKAGRRTCWTTVFQMGVKEAGQRRNKNLALCSLLGFQYVLVKWRLFLATFWVLSVLHMSPSMTPALQHSMFFLKD